jgi:hypothetical protein
LLELSRYAKRCEKKLVELTKDEVNNFSIWYYSVLVVRINDTKSECRYQ